MAVIHQPNTQIHKSSTLKIKNKYREPPRPRNFTPTRTLRRPSLPLLLAVSGNTGQSPQSRLWFCHRSQDRRTTGAGSQPDNARAVVLRRRLISGCWVQLLHKHTHERRTWQWSVWVLSACGCMHGRDDIIYWPVLSSWREWPSLTARHCRALRLLGWSSIDVPSNQAKVAETSTSLCANYAVNWLCRGSVCAVSDGDGSSVAVSGL